MNKHPKFLIYSEKNGYPVNIILTYFSNGIILSETQTEAMKRISKVMESLLERKPTAERFLLTSI